MKHILTGIFTILLVVSSLSAEENFEEAWFKSEALGRETQTIIRFCNQYAWGWLNQADPKTGLLPRTLEGSWLWNAKDCAADNFPFLLLTGYVTGQHHLKQAGLQVLGTERKLTPRLRSLPDTYDLATGKFARDKTDKNAARRASWTNCPISTWEAGLTKWLNKHKIGQSSKLLMNTGEKLQHTKKFTG